MNIEQLERWPPRKGELLQAFDNADRLALREAPPGPLLVINDRFGALTLGLPAAATWLDSARALRALEHNASLEIPPRVEPPLGEFAGVVLRIPKSMDLLAYQLEQLAGLKEGTPVVGAAMVKHLPHRAKELMETYVGPTQLSRAWKKARLLVSRRSKVTGLAVVPRRRREAEFDLELTALPGVFSAGKLDRGTRLLLQHLDLPEEPGRVLDLGCGDGILGLVAQRLRPRARLTFSDASTLAVKSAELNYGVNFPSQEAEFRWDYGLRGYQGSAFDLVLCNPPFHEGQQRGDTVAWSLFEDARRHLTEGGELWVVGNRHLNYHAKLRRLFQKVECLSRDPKFVVLRAGGS